MTEKKAAWLREILKKNGLALTGEQSSRLEHYSSLLLEWNRKINLISRKSADDIWEEQLLHSISFLTRIRIKDSASVIDMGTGGGLPGIPLKILMPALVLTLIDSTRKKIDAVQSMIHSLGLKDVQALWTRAEDLPRRPEGNIKFDYVICRGVGELDNIWKIGYPLLRYTPARGTTPADEVGGIEGKINVSPGSVIALKGGNMEEEVRHLQDKYKNTSITVIDIILVSDEVLSNNEKKAVILRPATGA